MQSRWHFTLHPDMTIQNPSTNSLNAKFLHPTHALLAAAGQAKLKWTSRDHRKHRHVTQSPRTGKGRRAANLIGRIGQMRKLEWWNISWWVAIAFTLGSIVWVINGFAVFLPLVNASVEQNSDLAGWSAWLGATIFEFGALFGVWEAWNRGDEVDFGWALGLDRGDNLEAGNDAEKTGKKTKSWKWFSTDPKYFRELGFLAAFAQYCGATIFWIAGWTSIPIIQDSIKSRTALYDGVYWSPQVIGGSGFIISSIFMMLEAQRRWFIPAPTSLGWHVGFWNLLGGIGFTLCGVLGYGANDASGIQYQSCLSTFWGGWSFLIGSIIQWYESVNPIVGAEQTTEKREPEDLSSSD